MLNSPVLIEHPARGRGLRATSQRTKKPVLLENAVDGLDKTAPKMGGEEWIPELWSSDLHGLVGVGDCWLEKVESREFGAEPSTTWAFARRADCRHHTPQTRCKEDVAIPLEEKRMECFRPVR